MNDQREARLPRRLQFLAQDPQNLPLLAECADLALELGRAGEAKTLVERALVLKPDDPHFKARLAGARLSAGDVAGAIEVFEALIKSGVRGGTKKVTTDLALQLMGKCCWRRC